MAALVHFDADGQWGETLVCEQRVSEALRSHGLDSGHGASPPDVQVHRVQGETGLFYIRVPQGYLGLLLEAQDWLAVPAGTQLEPEPGALPSLDAFVEQLLALMGQATDI